MSGQRYLHTELGRWTRRDPIGEDAGPSVYAVVENNIVNEQDLLGLYNLYVDNSLLRNGECGGFHVLREFRLQVSSPKDERWNGAIVQEVGYHVWWRTCGSAEKEDSRQYLEAWVISDSYSARTDHFRGKDYGDCTEGYGVMYGFAAFYAGYNVTEPPWDSGYKKGDPWGRLPHIEPPNYPLGLPSPSTAFVITTVDFNWNCCYGKSDTYVSIN